MKTLLIAEGDPDLREEMAKRLRAGGIPIEHILECSDEDTAMEYLWKDFPDVLLADARMNKLWKALKAGAGFRIRPYMVVTGPPGDFSGILEMMRYGVRDYLTIPLEPGQLENRIRLLEEELQNRSRYFESGNRVFCAQLRYFLLNPETADGQLLDDIEFFFREIFHIRGPYRAVIACPETGPLPIPSEITLEHMDGGNLHLFSGTRADMLMQPGETAHYLGISREHSTVRELYAAYREAADARKVAYVSCCSWEEYQDYHFEENPSLSLWKDRYFYEFSMDRLEIVENKLRHWFFEARHRQLSPFQLLPIMSELCREMNRFFGWEGQDPPDIPRCPLPEECLNGESFLEHFEQWGEECRKKLDQSGVSPQNATKIRKAMDFIRDHYQKNLNMATVSNYVSMNYSVFSCEFKKYAGINFVSYLKELRLREARRLLEETDQKVADIGTAVGYDNEKHFLKSFRGFYGLTPSEYRRSLDPEKKNRGADKQQGQRV